MRPGNIVLYVCGSGQNAPISPKEMQHEIQNCMGAICDDGSEHAVRYVVYQQDAFPEQVTQAIQEVRADFWVKECNLNQVDCIFLINSAMDGGQWSQCFQQVRQQMGKFMAMGCRYYAIVQKDDLDFSSEGELVDALTRFDMPIYVFQQQTASGKLLSSSAEEMQFLAYYAVLAGCGQLDSHVGVYAGALEKLSLMPEDFARIQRHYIVSALKGEEGRFRRTEEEWFADYFGKWAGNGVVFAMQPADVCKVLRKRLRSLFPQKQYFAILANEDGTKTQENIKEFFKINQETFENKAEKLNGIVMEWGKSFKEGLRAHPEDYCEETCKYLQDTLSPWLQLCAARILEDLERPNAYGAASPEGRSDFLTMAIEQTESQLRPMIDKCAAALLQKISAAMEEKVFDLRKKLSWREQLIRQKKWQLSDMELGDYSQHFRSIVDLIKSYCDQNLRPSGLLETGKSIEDYYKAEKGTSLWEKRVCALVEEVRQKTVVANLIDALNKAKIADFAPTLQKQMTKNGLRLVMDGIKVKATSNSKVLYLYSVNLDLTNGKALPGENGFLPDVTISVSNFDNVLKVETTRLEGMQAGNAESAEDRRNLLSNLGNSLRYVPAAKGKSIHREEISAEVRQQETKPSEEALAEATVTGNTLTVQYRKDFLGASLKCEFSGYNEEGAKRQPKTERSERLTNQAMQYNISGFYGNCILRVTAQKEQEGWPRVWEIPFRGARGEAVYYKVSRPVLGRTKTVNYNGDEVQLARRIFKLKGKRKTAVQAKIEIGGIAYPVGCDTKWTVYAPAADADSMEMSANDREGVLQMEANA